MSAEKKCDVISKEQLDNFTGDVLHGCLMLLDLSADSVYRICDVIVTVARRNGIEWQKQTLIGLIEKVCSRYESLIILANVYSSMHASIDLI